MKKNISKKCIYVWKHFKLIFFAKYVEIYVHEIFSEKFMEMYIMKYVCTNWKKNLYQNKFIS